MGLGLGFICSQIYIKASQIVCETQGEQKRIEKKKNDQNKRSIKVFFVFL